jgi:hypothetical protein
MRIALIAVALALIAGCGADRSESLPAACSEGPGAVTKALAEAPGKVVIDGITPISRCFNRDARGDDVQIVGSILVAVAQQLGDKARDGDKTAALRLGYLAGASQRGAKRNGLAGEMIRRIDAEVNGLGDRHSAYERGLRAGLARG